MFCVGAQGQANQKPWGHSSTAEMFLLSLPLTMLEGNNEIQ